MAKGEGGVRACVGRSGTSSRRFPDCKLAPFRFCARSFFPVFYLCAARGAARAAECAVGHEMDIPLPHGQAGASRALKPPPKTSQTPQSEEETISYLIRYLGVVWFPGFGAYFVQEIEVFCGGLVVRRRWVNEEI